MKIRYYLCFSLDFHVPFWLDYRKNWGYLLTHQEFYQVDTTNILFIVGGAFVGLDKIIQRRAGKKSLGFRADLQNSNKQDTENVLGGVQPIDLIKYGLIPECVGRLPVVGTLNQLDRDALIQIMSEPKNAIIKQYQRLFEYETVNLEFNKEALVAIADQAVERKIGARGLRMIIEDLMLDLMYNLPSQDKVKEIVVTKEVVENHSQPVKLIEKAG